MRVLVANRSEIAVRVVRALKELGLESVAVYSDADEEALHVKMANHAERIGKPPASKSYLDIDAVLDAAERSGADAIHPGYGFLAENAKFAAACKERGFIFVGPSAEAIERMGDKAAARRTAEEAGVPVVPGSNVLQDVEAAREAAASLSYPVMLKAAAGGGGRGIRVAEDEGGLEQLFAGAQQEAQSAFGDGSLYLEKLVEKARHIEVQVLGDGERSVHLFERECSLQRRRQKLIEEAPAPNLSSETRDAMTAASVRLADAVNYQGAGTVEYLVDTDSEDFYFIEMNTRIQVEHPVTEMITGVDLVAAQITIALGEPLAYQQEDIRIQGTALECRLNAEDPKQNFRPSPGTIETLILPTGPGVRVDTALYPGYSVPPYYDSMIGKLVIHAETRERVLARAKRALEELHIEGIPTTKALHQDLLNVPEVKEGCYHTKFLENWLKEEEAYG